MPQVAVAGPSSYTPQQATDSLGAAASAPKLALTPLETNHETMKPTHSLPTRAGPSSYTPQQATDSLGAAASAPKLALTPLETNHETMKPTHSLPTRVTAFHLVKKMSPFSAAPKRRRPRHLSYKSRDDPGGGHLG